MTSRSRMAVTSMEQMPSPRCTMQSAPIGQSQGVVVFDGSHLRD
ncbi:hypothetical protein N9L68_04050 [bacterium]|nr:hypothetical protein [bacterium]